MVMLTAVILLVASGFLWSGLLWRHQRLTTLLAAAGVLLQFQWLLFSVIQRRLLPTYDVAWITLVGAVLFIGVGWVHRREWSWPYRQVGSGYKDLWVISLLTVVIAGAAVVAQHNGFKDTAWITHGFYNGDTATLISLVQVAQNTAGPVTANPFAADASLEYPTALHSAVASATEYGQVGLDWFYFLPALTYLQILLTIPLFFLLWDIVFPQPAKGEAWLGVRRHWVIMLCQTMIVGYVLAVSWDNYVYPQSHFFLTALYLLHTALLLGIGRQNHTRVIMACILVTLVTITLVQSNAVMGTAALATLLLWCGWRAYDASASAAARALAVGCAVIALGAFMVTTPGNGAFGLPQFSYTAALDMVRLAGVVIVLLAAAAWQSQRQQLLGLLVSGLCATAFIAFFFSTRNIVLDNASRFFYHALLTGFPLLLLPLLRTSYWWRREWLLTTRSLPERLTGILLTLSLLGFFALPALASVASAFDNLLYKDERVVTIDERAALQWILDATPLEAIFITDPQPPWNIPVFTGRSVLRSDYWLSPVDDVSEKLVAAFMGNTEAQEFVVPYGDYIWLSQEQQSQWPIAEWEVMYKAPTFSIYALPHASGT